MFEILVVTYIGQEIQNVKIRKIHNKCDHD